MEPPKVSKFVTALMGKDLSDPAVLREAFFGAYGFYPEDHKHMTIGQRVAASKGISFASPSTIKPLPYLVPEKPIPKTLKKAGPNMAKVDLWKLIDSVAQHSRRILLYGPSGTGKTFVAANAHKNKRGVLQITMTEDTPAAELRGHFIPKGGEFVWMDGPAVLAWRGGDRLVINEIDRASADSLSFLFAVLDDPDFASFTLPNGEVLKPAEGFQVIATMNGVPEDLPMALQDRFPVTIQVNQLNPEAVKTLPVDLQGPARNSAMAKTEGQRFSIRMWMEFANLRDRMDANTAAQAVFGAQWQEALKVVTMNDILGETPDASAV